MSVLNMGYVLKLNQIKFLIFEAFLSKYIQFNTCHDFGFSFCIANFQ